MLTVMLKVLKRILLVVGLVAIVGIAIFFFFSVWQDVRNLYAVAVSNQSQTMLKNPNMKILIVTAATLVAGIIFGIGIAFPGKRRYGTQEIDKRVAERLADPDSSGPGGGAPR